MWVSMEYVWTGNQGCDVTSPANCTNYISLCHGFLSAFWARPRGRGTHTKVQGYAMGIGQVWARPRGRGTHIKVQGGCDGHGPGMGKAQARGTHVGTRGCNGHGPGMGKAKWIGTHIKV